MNLKFKIRKGAKSATIYFDFYALKTIRIRENTRFKIPIKSFKYWDAKNSKIKLPNDISNASSINLKLADYNRILTKELNHLYDTNSLSKEKCKSIINSVLNPNPVSELQVLKTTDFIAYYRDYIERHKTEVSIYTRKKLSKGTLKTMGNALNLLIKANKGKDYLEFDDITEAFIKKLIGYLMAQNYSDNYLGTIISKISTILKVSYNEGLHQNNIFQKPIFKRIKEEVDHVYLTSDEILKIQKLEIEDEKLAEARDIVLFATYSGMRVGDLTGFLRDDNKSILKFKERNVIRHIQSKTTKEVYIPIHDNLQSVLDKRKGVFPKYLSSEYLNKSIKTLCRLAKINEVVEISKTLGGKKVTIKKKKYLLVTMHSCRRSFCTNAILAKASPSEVMFASGHSSLKVFNNYIKASRLELVQTLLDSNMYRI